ncbi:LPXTG cell wall anchor domain-containing protein [Spirochaeta cellobiosiphila]|uniref:LPXTG cell wall anchor domain-containing protein n=1 Tax=Spirochaeta cellobiosiphila TaxID=504483 RepID=UPI0004077E62|nr:LPXTG cell wall anchor domain-containing protein [Spirochaeta cellobiosiphila]
MEQEQKAKQYAEVHQDDKGIPDDEYFSSKNVDYTIPFLIVVGLLILSIFSLVIFLKKRKKRL